LDLKVFKVTLKNSCEVKKMSSNKSLEEKLMAWLSGHGFPLEMRVAKKNA